METPAPTTTQTDPAAVWVAVADLTPWAQNPRQNASAIADVAKSIRRFGWGSPIVANKRDGTIIAGHTRFAAAQRLKLEQVPVRWLDLDPVDAHALALADNRIGEIATWDDAALAEVLRELKAADDSLLGDLGFDERELQKLLGDVVLPSPDEQPIGETWDVLCVCKDEASQVALLDKLINEGIECRALIS